MVIPCRCLAVSPASSPCVHRAPIAPPPPLPPRPGPPSLPPARNVRNENECISDSDKYPNDPTASHGSARPLRARNEQVIAMGRTFIIMPACLRCIRRSCLSVSLSLSVCLSGPCASVSRSGECAMSAFKYHRSLFRFYRGKICGGSGGRFRRYGFGNWKAMIDDVARAWADINSG